jgi:hypothetical protein
MNSLSSNDIIITVAQDILRKKLSQKERDQVVKGYWVELEHGLGTKKKRASARYPRGEEVFTAEDREFMQKSNVTSEDTRLTVLIALAHIRQHEDYYESLEKMETFNDANPHPQKEQLRRFFLNKQPPHGLPSKRLEDIADVTQKEYAKQVLLILGYKLSEPLPDLLIDQLVKGHKVEMEHGTLYGMNVTDDQLVPTLKIVLAHLWEAPNYYDLLQEYIPVYDHMMMIGTRFTFDVDDLHR